MDRYLNRLLVNARTVGTITSINMGDAHACSFCSYVYFAFLPMNKVPPLWATPFGICIVYFSGTISMWFVFMCLSTQSRAMMNVGVYPALL